VKLLLDTHTYLWALTDADRLSPTASQVIADPSNQLHLSIASLWEATIKLASGKLKVPGQSVEFLVQQLGPAGVAIIPITPDHLRVLESLPRLHGDPFDRILLCQSLVEQMPIISTDTALRRYQANILW